MNKQDIILKRIIGVIDKTAPEAEVYLYGSRARQISKIENNTKDVRFSTVLKVFEALKAKVKMTIEFDPNSQMKIA